jgi:hypothetical protein
VTKLANDLTALATLSPAQLKERWTATGSDEPQTFYRTCFAACWRSAFRNDDTARCPSS